jgi:hypothetical protein
MSLAEHPICANSGELSNTQNSIDSAPRHEHMSLSQRGNSEDCPALPLNGLHLAIETSIDGKVFIIILCRFQTKLFE